MNYCVYTSVVVPKNQKSSSEKISSTKIKIFAEIY